MYVLNMKLPAGYVVRDQPENVQLALPEKAGTFLYMVDVKNGRLMVHSRLKLNEMVFPAAYYDGLRSFFAQVVAKHAEPVVLQRASQASAGEAEVGEE